MPFEPYLSVVATARNDDHGGNLLGRLQAFVNALMAQSQLHALPVELVLVEWNPPAGRPPLAEVVRWPESGMCHVRILTVPPELHARYRHAAALPLYQMIGKNAGIRRAQGEFILATNIDVLFSTELWQFLAARKLAAGRMYRLDRYDAAAGVPVDAPPADQLAWCQAHLLRVNARDGTFPVTAEGLVKRPPPPETAPAGVGEYALAGARLLRDWVQGKRAIPPLSNLLHPASRPPASTAMQLHTNACGDFTLLHRSHWHDLRAYPEFDMYSMNIDSVFCFMAHFGGAPEEMLPDPMRIYHIEHGSGWTPEGHKQLFERLAAKGIPWLEFDEALAWAAQMERLQTPMFFNHEDWGLATQQLPEWTR